MIDANTFRLDGRLALVTGSSAGIGLALARGLGQAGASVVLNGRDAARLAGASGVPRLASHERQGSQQHHENFLHAQPQNPLNSYTRCTPLRKGSSPRPQVPTLSPGLSATPDRQYCRHRPSEACTMSCAPTLQEACNME